MAKKPVSYLAGSVLIGTAIGAVVSLLATPLSGKELRGAIRKRAEDATRDIPERLKAVPATLRDLPQKGRDAFADFTNPTKRRRDPDRPIDTTATTVEPEESDRS